VRGALPQSCPVWVRTVAAVRQNLRDTRGSGMVDVADTGTREAARVLASEAGRAAAAALVNSCPGRQPISRFQGVMRVGETYRLDREPPAFITRQLVLRRITRSCVRVTRRLAKPPRRLWTWSRMGTNTPARCSEDRCRVDPDSLMARAGRGSWVRGRVQRRSLWPYGHVAAGGGSGKAVGEACPAG
jgi:hypothetical protein